jgi:oligopeptide/dipeptide ABC transporter ATP-binding protein
VSLELPRGRTLGLVGESGSGKSLLALSILRLGAGRIVSGSVAYDGRELTTLPERELRALRGNRIAMIFQDPATSLNPVFPVGAQVAEALRVHGRPNAKRTAVELLERVGIPEPALRARAYPHELSGGMRQRVMIAMALACGPDVLIADEPTSALDVTIQAQILELLARLQRELGMSLLLITHDLGIVAHRCDEVAVMYAGQIVERAAAAEIFRAPRHPYTAGLVQALKFEEIPGLPPDLRALPAGCRFADRCPRVQAKCRAEMPALEPPAHPARCFFPEDAP